MKCNVIQTHIHTHSFSHYLYLCRNKPDSLFHIIIVGAWLTFVYASFNKLNMCRKMKIKRCWLEPVFCLLPNKLFEKKRKEKKEEKKFIITHTQGNMNTCYSFSVHTTHMNGRICLSVNLVYPTKQLLQKIFFVFST